MELIFLTFYKECVIFKINFSVCKNIFSSSNFNEGFWNYIHYHIIKLKCHFQFTYFNFSPLVQPTLIVKVLDIYGHVTYIRCVLMYIIPLYIIYMLIMSISVNELSKFWTKLWYMKNIRIVTHFPCFRLAWADFLLYFN